VSFQRAAYSNSQGDSEMAINYFYGDGLTPGVKRPVEESGGTTNRFVEKPVKQEHKFTCICDLCKKHRGDRTGTAAIYSQWYVTDPVYP
jgi:hypothetical protein